MKRLTLALCLFSPLFLVAGKNHHRKMVLPHGTTIEVGEKLVDLADTNKSPESPVDAGNLGLLHTEQLPFEQQGAEEPSAAHAPLLLSEVIESLQQPEEETHTTRPLSPADRSPNWRAETRLQSVNTCQFGDKIFVAAPTPSHADRSPNWRRDQNKPPKLAVIGAAMHLYTDKQPHR